jgi:predicted acetyltransferase
MGDELEMRSIGADEWPDFGRQVSLAFHEAPTPGERERWAASFEYPRSLAVFDGDRIVATAAAESNELTLPGLTRAPAAAVIAVTVYAPYRRRGLLRRMMARQLADVQERGEALAILTASESSIYQRFGYGAAADEVSYTISRDHADFVSVPAWDGTVEIVDEAGARAVLPDTYEAVRLRQPGAIRRSPSWWDGYFSADNGLRKGEKVRFTLVARGAGGVVEAYAAYTVTRAWPEGLGSHTLDLHQMISVNDKARAALWHFLLTRIDLVQTVVIGNSPVDEPLRWLLADPRRLRLRYRNDLLWLRIVDVPAALAACRYALPGSLVLEVHDRFRPETAGRYRLEGSPEGATCSRTGAEPDLSLAIEDLGSLYLGGVSPAALARAGRVREETSGALRRAGAMFACEPAPWCATHF